MTKTSKSQLTEAERAVCALADAGFSRISIARKLHISKREVREALIRDGRRVEDEEDPDEDVTQRAHRSQPNAPQGLSPATPGEWSAPPDHTGACRAHLADLAREYPVVAIRLLMAGRRGERLAIVDYGAVEAGRAAA